MTHSDCIAYLRTLPDASVDSCVTDPPYELGFMGKKWDSSGIAYFVELWREVLRVLKPGAHLLAFGGTRTHHRMVCAIEDAGFEIRDEMQYLYGSGFPKSANVSKMIDQQERDKWLKVGKAIDNTSEASILEAWKNYSENAPTAGVIFQSESPEAGQHTPACDSVLVTARQRASRESNSSNASGVTVLLSEVLPIFAGNPIALRNAVVAELNGLAESAGSQRSMFDSALCAAKESQSESTAATLRAGEALMTWLGKTKSSSKADTDALCAALTDDLRRITLSQSKTFQSFDTTQQTAFVSATTATITESTAASLISFTVATLRSKAIDKAAGAERDVVGKNENWRPAKTHGGAGFDSAVGSGPATMDITAPATAAAKQWDGWGTALKPACEPICVARKPLCGTVAANVLKHGTGGINVDGCRVEWKSQDDLSAQARAFSPNSTAWTGGHNDKAGTANFACASKGPANPTNPQGRWPANVILSHAEGCVCTGTKRVKGQADRGLEQTQARSWKNSSTAGINRTGHADASGLELVEAWQCVEGCPVRLLDAQSGESKNTTGVRDPNGTMGYHGGASGLPGIVSGHSDTGGASRFFYTAKASKSDREHFNTHATVKPLALMRYLVRLVTPPGGVVLDMFAGSGTTLVAARQEGFRFLGCDADEGHVRIAQDRLALELPFET